MKTITKFLFALFVLLIGASNIHAEQYMFYCEEGNNNSWDNLSNWWCFNGLKTHPGKRPTINDTVWIVNDAVINSAVVAGRVIFAPGRYVGEGDWSTVNIRITRRGGLTVGIGGITHIAEGAPYAPDPLMEGNTIIIENTSAEDYESNNGAGYLRIHPEATSLLEDIVVEYKTASNPGHFTTTNNNRDRMWQYVGAPGDSTVLNLDEKTWLYKWNGSRVGWIKEPEGVNFMMQPFAGYAITHVGVPSYTWNAKIIREDVEVHFPDDYDSDNIFANSYLAPLNVAAFDSTDFGKFVEQTFYIFNTGSWNEWNSSVSYDNNSTKQSPGQYTAIPVLAAKNLNSKEDPILIAPMQGVYVASRCVDISWRHNSICLNYKKHVWDPETGNVAMRAPQQSTLLRRIRIQAFGEKSGSDRMYIMEDKRCTPGYDNGYDAKNMIADGQVSIYTNEACGTMEVSSTNDMDGMYIGFQASVDTVYTLRFSSLIGENLYIKDLANGNMIELKDDATYTFTAKAKSVNNMRFQVLVDPFMTGEDTDGNTTDVDNVQSSNTFWMSDNSISVSTNQANSVATIYNVSGQMIMNVPFNNQVEIPTHNFSTGVYILQTNNERYKFIID